MKPFALLALSFILSACGTLEVGLEPTATIFVPTSTLAPTLTPAATQPMPVGTPTSPPLSPTRPTIAPTRTAATTSLLAAATATPAPTDTSPPPTANPTLAPTTTPVTLPAGVPIVRLALESDPFRAFSDIAVLNSDGSGYAQLTDYGYNTDPVLSPNSQFIAYRSIPSTIVAQGNTGPNLYRDLYNLWVITVDGAQAWKLTNSEELRSLPAWSPDSAQVAFSEGQAGRIVVADFAAGTQTVWLAAGGHNPLYTPDGRLAYITDNGSLAVLAAPGGASQTLVDAATLPPQTTVHSFAWLPNTGALVYALVDKSEQVSTSSIGLRYSTWLLAANGTPTLIADDVHDINPAPSGLILAGHAGAGYGDACMVDQHQSFLYANSASSWAISTVSTYIGRPKAEAFYPIAPLTWLTDRYAITRFAITCAEKGAGWYLIDTTQHTLQLIRPEP